MTAGASLATEAASTARCNARDYPQALTERQVRICQLLAFQVALKPAPPEASGPGVDRTPLSKFVISIGT